MGSLDCFPREMLGKCFVTAVLQFMPGLLRCSPEPRQSSVQRSVYILDMQSAGICEIRFAPCVGFERLAGADKSYFLGPG